MLASDRGQDWLRPVYSYPLAPSKLQTNLNIGNQYLPPIMYLAVKMSYLLPLWRIIAFLVEEKQKSKITHSLKLKEHPQLDNKIRCNNFCIHSFQEFPLLYMHDNAIAQILTNDSNMRHKSSLNGPSKLVLITEDKLKSFLIQAFKI